MTYNMFPSDNSFICYGHFSDKLVCAKEKCPNFYLSYMACGYGSRGDDNEYSCKIGGYINCVVDAVREKSRKQRLDELTKSIEKHRIILTHLEGELERLKEII